MYVNYSTDLRLILGHPVYPAWISGSVEASTAHAAAAPTSQPASGHPGTNSAFNIQIYKFQVQMFIGRKEDPKKISLGPDQLRKKKSGSGSNLNSK